LALGGDSPIALVVPAFEMRSSPSGPGVPRDASALRKAIDEGQAEGFHVSGFPLGHQATDFPRWWASQTSPAAADAVGKGLSVKVHGLDAYAVDYEEYFEPYVVAMRSCIPVYDERFRGYGLNKISHFYEMSQSGFGFKVIDHQDTFVVAMEHQKSPGWEAMYSKGADFASRARIAVHYETFKSEVQSRIAMRTMITAGLAAKDDKNGEKPGDIDAATTCSCDSPRSLASLEDLYPQPKLTVPTWASSPGYLVAAA
jgi:hypothetical protein